MYLSLLLCELILGKSIINNETEALTYLKTYGYATSKCGDGLVSCMSEELNLRLMLKDFQKQFKLPVTGKLDAATMQLMNQSRCGLPDREPSSLSLSVSSFTTASIWNKRLLTWSFRGTDPVYAYWIYRAFQKWRELIPQFTFQQVCSTCDADIFLSFQPLIHNHERNRGCAEFGESVLAHATLPRDGAVHFNKEKQWTDK